MEIKGLKLHRADGSVDTYSFPISYITSGSTGTGGGVSGDTGTSDRLYVYRSGDADFVNCTYSLGSNKTMLKPPFTARAEVGKGDGSSITEFETVEYTDHVRITYRSDDNSPSTVDYFNLALNTTFADYSKLCIEACFKHGSNTSEGVNLGYGTQCGYYDPSQSGSDGSFIVTGYVLQGITGDRALYEIDISEVDSAKTVSFMVKDQAPLCIYNIWLEK